VATHQLLQQQQQQRLLGRTVNCGVKGLVKLGIDNRNYSDGRPARQSVDGELVPPFIQWRIT